MIKLVKGCDNRISLHIIATSPVGDISGKFIANTVKIDIPKSKNGTEFVVSADDIEKIGDDFMISVINLTNGSDIDRNVRVPIQILPNGSDNKGFRDIWVTLVSIREVEGEGHGGGVKRFPTYNDFPRPGNVKYIYIAEDTGIMYRWDEAKNDYVALVSGSKADLAETNPESASYVLNKETNYLGNKGVDGEHPYVSVSSFVKDYQDGNVYQKGDEVFKSYQDEKGILTDGIFRCNVSSTTVPPPSEEWDKIDAGDVIQGLVGARLKNLDMDHVTIVKLIKALKGE